MFSHIDQNLTGIPFPKENFVFENSTFQSLLREYASRGHDGGPQVRVVHG